MCKSQFNLYLWLMDTSVTGDSAVLVNKIIPTKLSKKVGAVALNTIGLG